MALTESQSEAMTSDIQRLFQTFDRAVVRTTTDSDVFVQARTRLRAGMLELPKDYRSETAKKASS
jgi:hypothetical protein